MMMVDDVRMRGVWLWHYVCLYRRAWCLILGVVAFASGLVAIDYAVLGAGATSLSHLVMVTLAALLAAEVAALLWVCRWVWLRGRQTLAERDIDLLRGYTAMGLGLWGGALASRFAIAWNWSWLSTVGGFFVMIFPPLLAIYCVMVWATAPQRRYRQREGAEVASATPRIHAGA